LRQSIHDTLEANSNFAGHVEVMPARDESEMPRHIMNRLTRFAVATNAVDQFA
jgi:hypothetical protein